MKMNKIFFLAMTISSLVMVSSCKKELNVGNPNQPTLDNNVTTEKGLISITTGSVYLNGIANGSLSWLGNSYLSLPYAYSELLADMVSAEAANQIVNIINFPEYYKATPSSAQVNADSKMRDVVRLYNSRPASSQGNNAFLYIWTSAYALNSACNTVLSKVDAVTYTGDAETKKKTIRAFCYFWKGWAYSQIGSWYYAGIINDDVLGNANGNYKLFTDVIAESNKNYNTCATILDGIPAGSADYTSVLGAIIPSFCQTGKGGVLTTDEWKRNINTLLARNILVNKLSPFVNNNPSSSITGSSMQNITAADWNQIITLTNNGIRSTDKVFTARSAEVNGFTSATSGNVAAQSSGPAAQATFKLGERFIQYFKTGDKRFANNFTNDEYPMNSSFSTRYSMIDGGDGLSGVIVYGNKSVGEYEGYLAGTYEENALMLAEAKIRTGDISGGVTLIDQVRSYQGAGLSATTASNLTDAMKELVAERRVALVFRGLSYFDSRRWGWIYDISKGGGAYNQTIWDGVSGNAPSTTGVINYNFLDYWDVPADEFDLNPPAAGSAAIKNPN